MAGLFNATLTRGSDGAEDGAILVVGDSDGCLLAVGASEGCLLVVGASEGCLLVVGASEGCLLAVGEEEGRALMVGTSEGCLLVVGASEGGLLAVGDSEGSCVVVGLALGNSTHDPKTSTSAIVRILSVPVIVMYTPTTFSIPDDGFHSYILSERASGSWCSKRIVSADGGVGDDDESSLISALYSLSGQQSPLFQMRT